MITKLAISLTPFGMTTDVLDPSALLQSLPTRLPESQKTLKSPQDGIVALFHTVLATLNFRLIAVDPDAPSDTTLANRFPSEWNKHGPSHYTLIYRHEQSSLEFSFNTTKLRGRTLINAIAVDVRLLHCTRHLLLLTAISVPGRESRFFGYPH